MVETDEPGALAQVPGLLAAGSAVVALGRDDQGGDVVALWQISLDGRPTGAWMKPQDEAFGDRATARQLLTCVERRALTAADPSTVDTVLSKLTVAADFGDVSCWWTDHAFSPMEAVAELVARRVSFERTVARAKGAGRIVAGLGWARDFVADDLPSNMAELRELARLGAPAGAPVVSEVMTVVNVLHWIIQLWRETEQVKGRRKYVLEAHGPAEALPPSWLTAVTTANVNRLAL